MVLSGEVNEVRYRFKSHHFTLCDSEQRQGSLATEGYEVLGETRRSSGITELRIRKDVELRNSDLLQRLAQRYEILSFAEELPSMHDIFIQTVSSNTQTSTAL